MATRPVHRVAGVLALSVLAAPAAIAQDDAANQPEPAIETAPAPTLDRGVFNRMIADLDSPDLKTRELASERLAVLPGLTLDDVLERLASETTLAPEQTRRLEQIAAHLFRTAPKAGLGVQFGRQNAARGVLIEATVDPDRFPAANILRAGDYIAEVRGRPVRSPDDLRAAILSHLPGETMPSVVLRADERLELDLPLGNFDMLGRTERIEPDLARRCVLMRMERLVGLPPEPAALGTDVTPSDWARAGDAPDGQPRRRAAGATAHGVRLGGTARANPDADTAGVPLDQLVERVNTSGAFDPSAMSPEQRLEWYIRLEQSYNSLNAQIRTMQVLLRDPGITSAEADSLEERIRGLRYEQREVANQMATLQDLGIDP